MGILTFGGMIIAFGFIIIGILITPGSDMMAFVDAPSFMVVVMPTIGCLIATFPLSVLAKIPAHMMVLLRKEVTPEQQIEKIVELANKVRSGGILALEEEQLPEPTMAYGVRMIVDGVNEDEIKNALEESLASMSNRHNEVMGLYEKAAAYAPGFGMCGTVVGLINMLLNLDMSDPNAINALGGNMSLALITTLYGSVLANIIFLPLTARLKLLHKREMFYKTLICTGLLAIPRGSSPTFIYELLCEQLSQSNKKKVKNPKDKGAD